MSFKWQNDSIKRNFGFNLEGLKFSQNRFHAIYFVDSLSGSLLLSNRYSERAGINSGIYKNREDLISSFLNALNMFIKEIKNNNDEEIQEINFKKTRILYEKRGRLLCIGISKKTNLQIEREIIQEIMKDFYERFENEINGFKGYIEPKILEYKTRLRNLNLNSLISFNKNM